MKNSAGKTQKREKRRAGYIEDTAEVAGVSPRSVQRVLSGDQENRRVLDTFMVIQEVSEKMHNQLIEEVKKLVPFE